MRRLPRLSVLAVLSLFAWPLAAAEPEVLVFSLKNPTGVAVQPGTGDVFISDSAAKRILRYHAAEGKKPEADVVIKGFPQDIYGKGPMYDIGPLGLGFMKQNMLVVGGGGLKDGEELLRVYELPKSGELKADDMKYKLGPIGPSDKTAKGEGNFYGVAVSPQAIYITCNGDDTKGWVARAEIKDNVPSDLQPFIATKVATGVDAPVAITMAKDGNLVVGQMGEMNVPRDSLLTVYDAKTGKLLWKAETGLFDIAGLAYSPSGKLYAVDFAWMDTKEGGVFRLDVSGEGEDVEVKAEKIASLDKPSALAFGKDGAMYVTVFGTAKEGDTKGAGQLLKITGDL